MHITKRCSVCSRFRSYAPDDRYCIVCGHETLEAECSCGRAFEYALSEGEGPIHCPRCGKRLRGRDEQFDA